jgi:hypothetical protein
MRANRAISPIVSGMPVRNLPEAALYTQDDREQRAATLLKNVAYRHFVMAAITVRISSSLVFGSLARPAGSCGHPGPPFALRSVVGRVIVDRRHLVAPTRPACPCAAGK